MYLKGNCVAAFLVYFGGGGSNPSSWVHELTHVIIIVGIIILQTNNLALNFKMWMIAIQQDIIQVVNVTLILYCFYTDTTLTVPTAGR